jgi:hypothetical protein
MVRLNMKVRRGTVALAIAGLALPAVAAAHGTVGDREFIEPLFTEDANPKNEFVVAKPLAADFRAGGNALTLGFALEKKLAERFSLALEGEWSAIHRAGGEIEEPEGSGFGNLGVLLKASLFESVAHEARVSVGTEIELPTGSEDAGAEEDAAIAPLLMYAKGFGDLPPGLAALRPLFVQGDLGLEAALGAEGEANDDVVFYRLLVGYSLPYLADSPAGTAIPARLRGLVPAVELAFESRVQGEERATAAAATPALFWVGRYLEVGLGASFGLNDHTETERAIVGLVDLFLDDLTAVANWTLF